MLRIALKGILARRWRLFTTGIAIVLGVAFIAGTSVLGDVLSRGANGLIDAALAGIDVQVRSSEAQESELSAQVVRPEIDAQLLPLVRAVDGVARAEPGLQAPVAMLDKTGKRLPQFGPPTLAFNWVGDRALDGGIVRTGRAPSGASEAMLDFKTAEEFGFAVGDTVTVQFPTAPAKLTVVGIAGLGDDGTTASGAHIILLETAALQSMLKLDGRVSWVAVRGEPGVGERTLARRIQRVLPDKIEAVTGEDLIDETQASVGQIIGVITDLVAAFGWLAVFVALFVIYNTFSILVAQRTREMALLRAIGASRKQLLGSVVLEAFVVGSVAALSGLALGFGLASGLQRGLTTLLPLADEPPRFTASAVITSLLVGVLATVLSALIPAVRATMIPPVAALSETAVEARRIGRTRLVVGAAMVIAGAAMVIAAVEEAITPVLTWVGAGSALLFLSVLVVGPSFAGRVTGWLGGPLPRVLGPTGRLAQQNAVRNPKRTTATAAALTIGVGVVVVIAVIATSFKDSFTEIFQSQVTADLIVDSGGAADTGLPDDVRNAVAGTPGVANVASMRFGEATVLNSADARDEQKKPASERDPSLGASTAPIGKGTLIFGIEPDDFLEVLDLGTVEPSPTSLRDGGVMIERVTAEENGWTVGDRIDFWFGQLQTSVGNGRRSLPIQAIYDKPFAIGGEAAIFVTNGTFHEVQPPNKQVDALLYVQIDADASTRRVTAAVKRAIAPLAPIAGVSNVAAYLDQQIGPINGLLNLIYAMLALAVLVALVGIWNTLLLSIHERTREIGVLRAIGMSRTQIRRAVRFEALIIALFGTLLGLLLGVSLSIAFVRGFEEQGIRLFLPIGQLVTIAVGGALAGTLAAIWPSRKAAATNVIQAISSE